MKTATVLIDSIKLDPKTNFAINDFFSLEEKNGKVFLKAIIEDNPTIESGPTLIRSALYLNFPQTLISTFCKRTDEDYYKSFWKPVILFSYYGKTEYKISNKYQVNYDDLNRLKEWCKIIIEHNKSCSKNNDLRCTSWNIAYNEYLDAISCGIAEKAFAHLITALEALLIEGNSELNHRVSLSTALLFKDVADERKEVYELVKKAYLIRSITVHGDAKALKKKLKAKEIYEILFDLKSIVSNLLFRLYGKEKSEIISAIETAQYSSPSVMI